MKSLLTSFMVLVCLGVAAEAEEFRSFTNNKGQSIKAKFLSSANGSVTIQREDGRSFSLPLDTLSAEDQEFIKKASAAPARPAGSAMGIKSAPGPNDKVSAEQVNAAIGAELFEETSLWQTAATDVAKRLKLREESKTKTQSSYRLYPKDDLKMFGTHPYSVALYAEDENVTSLSLVFANKGDLFSAKGGGELHFDKDTPPAEAAKIVKTAMNKDLSTISESLSKVLGEPKKERFGERGASRMNMQRWDWRGHSILLADAESQTKEPEYVGLQIVTTAFADAGGKTAHTSDAVIREHAKSNIENRKSGDVVITDIPMVDQGPKGYCVPATAERAMRFMGLPADMYVLANAGGTGFGGGTSVEALLQGVGRLIRAKGRSFDSWEGEMKMKEIARHIDKGIPIIWALFSTKEFNETANKRTAARKDVTDWALWKSKVTSEASDHSLPKDKETAHVVLIIGYNKDTGEIAFSDSWGEKFKERWITLSEAEQVSQKHFYLVGF